AGAFAVETVLATYRFQRRRLPGGQVDNSFIVLHPVILPGTVETPGASCFRRCRT
uniref:Uncharacterized protein n=1 Tax=Anopheles dirus TaxID=7168 RepID=A0A182NYV4_9DIPT